jgi:hypothetical protein
MFETERKKLLMPKSTFDAVALLISLISSEVGVLFIDIMQKSSLRKNPDQGALLAAYTLGQWAAGKISTSELKGPIGERLSKEEVKDWAQSFAMVSTYFKNEGVEDPIMFLVKKDLIKKRPDGPGYMPNENKIKTFFSI